MKYVVILDSDLVRRMCNCYEYCECCDNEEYALLLKRCDGVKTPDEILEIATQIAEYSGIDRLSRQAGFLDDEIVHSIAFNLLNNCTTIAIE
jgi:hypothetical protein